MNHHMSPLGALARGVVAGAAGTGALTVFQLAEAKFTGGRPPAGAGIVAKRILEGVFQRPVPDERLPVLNQVMHWTYGSAWGGVYGITQASVGASTPVCGAVFGTVVGGAATIELPALGLMPSPRETPVSVLVSSTVQHLMYGLVAAATFRALERRSTR